MTTAYLDCFSGISGDMLLGAFLDAGLNQDDFLTALSGLGLDGYSFESKKTQQHAITAIQVLISAETTHHHRSHADIANLICKSTLTPQVKKTALAIFQTLAEAEAAIHNVPADTVHFHEVGAVDSIVDIVGAAIALELMGITKLIVSPLPMGKGWAHCQHGKIPMPAPAVLKLCEDLEVYGVEITKEMVTPTGAAIVKTCGENGPMPAMTIKATGYGAGTHELDQPNVLRLVIGEEYQVSEAQEIEVIECNLDDWSPEPFPHLCDILLAQGALDVSLIAIHMKKGRPGFLLRVLADLKDAQKLKETILCETTAIGLRFRREQRLTLPREEIILDTKLGEIQAKKVTTPRGTRIYPEYEACREMADRLQIPIMDVYTAVQKQQS